MQRSFLKTNEHELDTGSIKGFTKRLLSDNVMAWPILISILCLYAGKKTHEEVLSFKYIHFPLFIQKS